MTSRFSLLAPLAPYPTERLDVILHQKEIWRRTVYLLRIFLEKLLQKKKTIIWQHEDRDRKIIGIIGTAVSPLIPL
jgi:hypothetical protein